MNRLYLVGTNHEDPKGVSRLERIFDWTRPSMITVESDELRTAQALALHEDSVRNADGLGKMLSLVYDKEHTEYFLQVMRAMCFDQWLPSVYGKKYHVPVRLIDDARHVEAQANLLWQAHYEARIGKTNTIEEFQDAFFNYIATCDPVKAQAEHDAVYDATAVPPEWDTPLYYGICARRETGMEERIREAVAATDGNVLHVGGNMHLFGEHYNLHDRLKDLDPIRIKLRDADSF